MRIVIIGAGEVGFHVAKALSQENFDITIVEIDLEKCRYAAEHLDVMVVEGNGASPKNLHKAQVESADYVLALTRIDEVNLIASQQAHVLGAKKIIARLRNQQYTQRNSIIRPEKYGIDLVIHPEHEACQEIMRLVRHPYATQVMDFEGGRLQMIGIHLNNYSNILGKSVKDICDGSLNFKFGVVTVISGSDNIVPWGDYIFQSGDTAYFIVRTDYLEGLLELIGIESGKSNRIMIFGGSKIGRSLAENLQNERSVRLVEESRDKAEQIAKDLENTMVINADGRDIEFLRSENIQEIDSFVAVTSDEQTNIMAGILAHHFGVSQSIVHINTTQYLPVLQNLGIGSIMSKNMSTVNTILREIYSDETGSDLFAFEEMDVDVIEFNPKPGSKVTQKPLEELDFPRESIVGVINHHGHISIARGSSQLSEEDTVLVFAKKSALSKLHKLFGSNEH